MKDFNKYLTGWQKNNFKTNELNLFIENIYRVLIARIFLDEFDGKYRYKIYSHFVHHDYIGFSSSLGNAKQSCNEILVKWGYEFIGKERADKLMLLL